MTFPRVRDYFPSFGVWIGLLQFLLGFFFSFCWNFTYCMKLLGSRSVKAVQWEKCWYSLGSRFERREDFYHDCLFWGNITGFRFKSTWFQSSGPLFLVENVYEGLWQLFIQIIAPNFLLVIWRALHFQVDFSFTDSQSRWLCAAALLCCFLKWWSSGRLAR